MRELAEPTYQRFVTGPLRRFDERNTAFSQRHRRRLGEHAARGAATAAAPQTASETRDRALAEASRTIDRLVRRSLYARDLSLGNLERPPDSGDPLARALLTRQVKSAALWLGADLVGICEVNPAWVYSHWGDFNASFSGDLARPGEPIDIPDWFRYAIVLAIEENYEEIRHSPDLKAEEATCMGYARMAFVAPSLAAYIGHLGYHAMPCGNDVALSVPLAVDAGLGELGRNGILITERFGPRVRLCKVFTDLPLEVDVPVDLGVQHFCERCLRCAQECPSKAIPFGQRTDEPWDTCNGAGLLKWPVRASACIGWWNKNARSCTNCIRVCPYNKPPGWLHSAVRSMVRRTARLDRFLVTMDRALGYGKQAEGQPNR